MIPGASSVQQVEANAAAADIELADDEAAELTAQARAFRRQGLASSALDQVQAQATAAVGKVRERLPFG